MSNKCQLLCWHSNPAEKMAAYCIGSLCSRPLHFCPFLFFAFANQSINWLMSMRGMRFLSVFRRARGSSIKTPHDNAVFVLSFAAPRTGLRTVPTIVILHTFCASRDTRISQGLCLLIQGYFCAVQNYSEKAEFSKWSWYPKRKVGVTTHF